MSRARKEDERQQSRPARQAQPGEKELRYTDSASAAAEEGLIRLLYLEPSLGRSPQLPPAEDFSSPALGHIYTVIRQRIDRGETVSTSALSEALSLREMSLLVELLQKPEVLSQGERALADYIEKIRQQKNLAAGSTDLRALADSLRDRKGYKGKDV